jgi:hypothetical protein
MFEFENEEIYRAFKDAATNLDLGHIVETIESGYLEKAPRGGYHLPYRCEEISGNTKLAREPAPAEDDPNGVSVLIETRGEGGFFICAPSFGKVHPTRKPYELLQGGFKSIATITPEQRRLLFDLARTFDRMPIKDVHQPPICAADSGRPGDDFNERADWREILEPSGWRLVFERGSTGYWRRPGKDRGVSATTDHNGSGLLYVFSTSTTFEDGRGYCKFSAYAILRHNGDFQAAARELAGCGYGTSSNGKPQVEAWPDPEEIREELKPVEPLPPAIIPEPFRPWLLDISHRMQCPLDFVAAGAVVVAGAIIGAGCGIRPKQRDDWTVIPNLWGGIIARPSMLKTPSLAEVMKPLARLEVEAKERFESDIKYHEAEIEAYKAQKDALKTDMQAVARKKKDCPQMTMDALKRQLVAMEEPEPPVRKRFKTNDSTIEKLGELLNENPRGILLFRDELIGLLCSWDREDRKQDRAFYLEAWNGFGNFTFDRIVRGTVDVRNCCISILGGIQPSKLMGYLQQASDDIANDGMVQRFQVLVYPDEPKQWELIDKWPDSEAKNNALEVIKKLSDMDFLAVGAELPGSEKIPFFRFSPDGQAVFNDWLTELEAKLRLDDMPIIIEHLAKYRSLMPSLALIFHLINIADGKSGGPVTKEAAVMAAAWCEFLESHARRIYTIVGDIGQRAAAELAAVVGLLHAALLLTLWWARPWWRTWAYPVILGMIILLLLAPLLLETTGAWSAPLWYTILILTHLHLIAAWLLLRPASAPPHLPPHT